MKRKKNLLVIVGLLGIFSCAFMLTDIGCQPVMAEAKAVDFLMAEADSRNYSTEEIQDMPLQVVCYAKNEIYARHGRKFISRELTDYFDAQSWYQGTVEAADFSETVLNDFEKANISLLNEREHELSAGGYALDAEGYDISVVSEYLKNHSEGNAYTENTALWASEGLAYFENTFYRITLPADLNWNYEASGDDAVVFYYRPARSSGYDGTFLTITAFDWGDDEYSEWPDWRIAGLDAEKKYVASLPTDVRFDGSDSTQAEEYKRLQDFAQHCSQDDSNSIFTVLNP